MSNLPAESKASNLSIQPPQRLLFGPGPSQIDPRVYEALGLPIVGHLDAYFCGSTKRSSKCSGWSSAPRTS